MAGASYSSKAYDDIIRGFLNWRIWWLLGVGDIRQRYARSFLGQFWITFSMGIFVAAIAMVYGVLFNQSYRDFLPYVTVNFVVWSLISGIMIEGVAVFTQAETFMRQAALPKTVFIMRLLARAMVNFAHNAILIPIVLLVLGRPFAWTWVLVPFGLLLIMLAGYFAVMLIGVLCTRFRDLPQVVQNLVQISFFVTPIMWPAEALSHRLPFVIDYNPFAAFLHVVAEPMRGVVPSTGTYLLAIGTIIALAAVGLPLFARFRARLVYWL